MSILSLSRNWCLLAHTPSLYTGFWIYGMEYSPDQLRVSCPSSAPSQLLSEDGKVKIPLLGVNTTQHQLKHQCVTDVIVTLHSKHRFGPDIRKKMNSVPTKTGTTPELGWEVQCLLFCIPHGCLRDLWSAAVSAEPMPLWESIMG